MKSIQHMTAFPLVPMQGTSILLSGTSTQICVSDIQSKILILTQYHVIYYVYFCRKGTIIINDSTI